MGDIVPDVDEVFPPYEGYSGRYYRRKRQRKFQKKVQFIPKRVKKKPSQIMWLSKNKHR